MHPVAAVPGEYLRDLAGFVFTKAIGEQYSFEFGFQYIELDEHVNKS
jgi:hypothetical protein